ncbi:endonuclease domain-containing protein [Geobacter hydrogenophilus]|uniref:DUF559 domain-containing protein n=1 Tax=Geobacter hydrogenophilus TaxID=40983 RepID=A0A9W6G2G1_9BACT|nr:endonuclease domain-containing protein [Geobacter hydrogenophilus]MBT0892930.1 endonuclease domain-containing protein [Geobacter hydrogenophilus]GLI39236.1 hypothetical protein GHYDROH2_27370 [Geobacter hydrogenophilus]
MAVPSTILDKARVLRANQTDAESLLWGILRGRRFCGVKFRRQHPVGGFILDFYCHDSLLAIELDGGGHAAEEQRAYDDERTRALEAAGIRVLRFWNNDVISNTDTVLAAVYEALFPSPLPLSPGARGEIKPSP